MRHKCVHAYGIYIRTRKYAVNINENFLYNKQNACKKSEFANGYETYVLSIPSSLHTNY